MVKVTFAAHSSCWISTNPCFSRTDSNKYYTHLICP